MRVRAQATSKSSGPYFDRKMNCRIEKNMSYRCLMLFYRMSLNYQILAFETFCVEFYDNNTHTLHPEEPKTVEF